MGCANCVYCAEGMKKVSGELCCACVKMPSNDPAGCGYMEIDRIDYAKNRMWFCPLKITEITNTVPT